MKSKPADYLPGALLDLEESAAWYEEHQSGIGRKFHQAVEATERKVRRNPSLGTPYRRDTRKWRIRHFPHNLIYREEPHRILIVAVAHAKRKDDYWHSRLV